MRFQQIFPACPALRILGAAEDKQQQFKTSIDISDAPIIGWESVIGFIGHFLRYRYRQ